MSLRTNALLLVLGLWACGALTVRDTNKLIESTADENVRAFEGAKASALREHQLTPRAVQRAGLAIDSRNSTVRIVETVAAAPDRGLIDNEQLVRIELNPGEPPPLALVIPSCANGQNCGCREPLNYTIGINPAGREVVLRLREVVSTNRIHRAGTCSHGCGQPTPPQPPRIYLLKESIDTLRFVDVTYPYKDVTVICDVSLPLP